MSAAESPQGANYSPSGGSAAAELANEAASVGALLAPTGATGGCHRRASMCAGSIKGPVCASAACERSMKSPRGACSTTASDAMCGRISRSALREL